MSRILAAIVIVAFVSGGLMGQTAVKSKRVPVKQAVAAKSRTPAKSKGKSAAKSKAKPPVRRWVQSQPTPERYKEIQQALADKGYFRGAVDGAWGADSVDALKRFQTEQNLDPDGKLGSLALIALGLGPRRGVPESAPDALGVDAPQ